MRLCVVHLNGRSVKTCTVLALQTSVANVTTIEGLRASDLEKALAANFRVEALAGLSIDPSGLLADLNGTPEYRAHLMLVMARRAIKYLGSAQSYK